MTLRRKLAELRKTILSMKKRGYNVYLRYALFCLFFRFKKAFDNAKKEIKNPKVLLVSLPKHTIDYPPLGIAYLKAYLEKDGISCKCIDFNLKFYRLTKKIRLQMSNLKYDTIFKNEESFKKFCDEGFYGVMEEWTKEILSLKPKFIGFSLTSPMVYFPLKYISKKIKASNPEIKIIFGGPSCKSDGEYFIRNKYADIIILGRGEKALGKTIKSLENDMNLDYIKGIIYIKGDKVIQNSGEELIQNLDSLPFPSFDDFELEKYHNKSPLSSVCYLPITASVGCTRNCKFCRYNFYWKKFLIRSPENVFNEMKYQKYRHGTCVFAFTDAMLNSDLNFLEKLCDLIIESKEIFFWGTNFGLKDGIKREIIEKMAKAGCNYVLIGLESGSEKVRSDMLKPSTNREAVRQLKLLNDAGIMKIRLNFIIGYPSETEEDFKDTMSFIKENEKYFSSTYFYECMVVPDTILDKTAERIGIKFDGPDRVLSWSLNNNTPKERSRRLDTALEIVRKIGISIK